MHHINKEELRAVVWPILVIHLFIRHTLLFWSLLVDETLRDVSEQTTRATAVPIKTDTIDLQTYSAR